MLDVIFAVLRALLSGFQPRSRLALENLALRHQLAVLKRQTHKPKLSSADRLLWVGLRRLWPQWPSALLLFQPQTIIAWHRLGFRLFWRWKSRVRDGRPSLDGDLVALIQQTWQANLTWGSPRIQAELAKLGIQISDSTVRKYRPKHRRSASAQMWKTFLQAVGRTASPLHPPSCLKVLSPMEGVRCALRHSAPGGSSASCPMARSSSFRPRSSLCPNRWPCDFADRAQSCRDRVFATHCWYHFSASRPGNCEEVGIINFIRPMVGTWTVGTWTGYTAPG